MLKYRRMNTLNHGRTPATETVPGHNGSSGKDEVEVRIEEMVIPTHMPAPPDKNPMFLEKRVYQGSSGKVYPLPFTDRISETAVDRKWKAIWIENRYIRALVLPEIGGRIHVLEKERVAFDKWDCLEQSASHRFAH